LLFQFLNASPEPRHFVGEVLDDGFDRAPERCENSNATVTEGRMGEGVYEAVVTTLAGA